MTFGLCFFFFFLLKNIYLFISLAMLGLGCGTWDLSASLQCLGTLVVACGIQFPNQGSNLGRLHWECGLNHWDHQASLRSWFPLVHHVPPDFKIHIVQRTEYVNTHPPSHPLGHRVLRTLAWMLCDDSCSLNKMLRTFTVFWRALPCEMMAIISLP